MEGGCLEKRDLASFLGKVMTDFRWSLMDQALRPPSGYLVQRSLGEHF